MCRIRAVGGLCEGGENCLKNDKEGRENKDFKKGGQAASKGECLKNGRGPGTPLRTMERSYVRKQT